MQLLSRLTHEERHTVAIVTHDTRVALKADRLVVLLDGLICYDGPPTREALAVIEEDKHS
jgi:ABC-type lipoprotein export system ATPase subunit